MAGSPLAVPDREATKPSPNSSAPAEPSSPPCACPCITPKSPVSPPAPPSGSRTISAEDAITLAESFAETAENDRSFSYWLQALLLDSGCDEMVMEYLSMLPDWVASFVDEEEGRVRVTPALGGAPVRDAFMNLLL